MAEGAARAVSRAAPSRARWAHRRAAARVVHPRPGVTTPLFPDTATTRLEERGGQRSVVLESPQGRAVVQAYGAHVTSWQPADGRGEALFLSERARLDGSAAIRGGVPVIFPQFGPGPLPKHGFARTRRWRLDDTTPETPGEARARFLLRDAPDTRQLWPHAFDASLTVALDEGLTITLVVTNTDDAPLAFTAALHTYLRVSDIEKARVHGLERARVRDQLTRVETVEPSTPLAVLGQVDRVYVGAPARLRIEDPGTSRTITLETRGFPDVVVWNPWEEGTREIADLSRDEWRAMLCVEPAIVAEPVQLAPGAVWEGVQRLTIG